MRTRLPLAAASLAVLALTGCAATEAAPVVTPSPEPAVIEATPEQVASVIAEYEADWREVIDKAGDCRFTWVLDSTPIGQMEGLACYTREHTIGISSQVVVKRWAELEIPASMEALVDKTTAILELIAEVDLRAVCGEESLPTSTDECTAALGGRSFQYSVLEGQLDAWKPYL